MSVVMPTRNAGRFLPLALDSLRCQTFTDFEVIAVDGGSHDGTAAILHAIAIDDPRFRVLDDVPGGLVGALNRGIASAKGSFIARMDADDVAAPERLALQVAFLEANPAVGVVGTALRVIDEQGRFLHTVTYPADPDLLAWKLNFGCYLGHPSTMLRRELLGETPYRPEDALVEDYGLWCRLSTSTRLSNLPEALVDYRIHPTSVTQERTMQQLHKTARIVGANLSGLLGEELDENVALALVLSGRGLAVDDPDAAAGAQAALSAIALHVDEKEAITEGLRREIRRDLADRAARLASSVWSTSRRQALHGLVWAAYVAPGNFIVRGFQALTGRLPSGAKMLPGDRSK